MDVSKETLQRYTIQRNVKKFVAENPNFLLERKFPPIDGTKKSKVDATKIDASNAAAAKKAAKEVAKEAATMEEGGVQEEVA